MITDEMRNESRLQKLSALTQAAQRYLDEGGDVRVFLNTIRIQGGPSIDRSDFSSQETVLALVRWLNAYPRTGGIA